MNLISNFVFFHDQFENKKLLDFILEISRIHQYFGHLVYWNMKSISVIHAKKFDM